MFCIRSGILTAIASNLLNNKSFKYVFFVCGGFSVALGIFSLVDTRGILFLIFLLPQRVGSLVDSSVWDL